MDSNQLDSDYSNNSTIQLSKDKMVDETKTQEELLNKASPAVDYFTPIQLPAAGTFLGMIDSTKSQPLLFTPLKIRDVEFQNRIWVSPMCQYSSSDGQLTDWHLVQLGGYATRGASLVIVEATAIAKEGRGTAEDAGLWKDEQIPSFKRVVDFIHSQGQKAGIQLIHTGRKASTVAPWNGSQGAFGLNGWPEKIFGPSALSFGPKYATPKAMTVQHILDVICSFAASACRAVEAGFDVIELQGAHGYLLHQFLSPASNHRTDSYGGSFENRIRISVEVVRAIRAAIPAGIPLLFRVSATDWLERGIGWEPEDSIKLSTILLREGVDLMDVSTGGLDSRQKIPVMPAFQVPFAQVIKDQVPGMLTGAVGMIYNAELAMKAMDGGQVDAVLVAREFSRNPNFVLDVANALGVKVKWPLQLHRAEPGYRK